MLMEKGNCRMLLETFMKESSKCLWLTDLEFIQILMVQCIWEHGNSILSMEKEWRNGATDQSLKESILRAIKRVLESSFLPILTLPTEENGKIM